LAQGVVAWASFLRAPFFTLPQMSSDPNADAGGESPEGRFQASEPVSKHPSKQVDFKASEPVSPVNANPEEEADKQRKIRARQPTGHMTPAMARQLAAEMGDDDDDDDDDDEPASGVAT